MLDAIELASGANPQSALIVLHGLGATEVRHAAGYVSAVLFLVPGFPLVTGGLDLVKLAAGCSNGERHTSPAVYVFAISG